jgi:para-aminobenzoate synthetase component 1
LQRQKATFRLANGQYKEIKQKMLNWSSQFSIFLFLDSNNYPSAYKRYECLLAAGCAEVIEGNEHGLPGDLQQLHNNKKDWLFGHISYDYKNQLEKGLVSRHAVKTEFPLFHFFRPQIVCYINKECTLLTIESLDVTPETIYTSILCCTAEIATRLPRLQFRQAIDKDTYLQTITKLRQHIAAGDCYEINFCNEGYCENAVIDPLPVFVSLNTLSPAPFAAYYRLNDKYALCASPERYLQKNGNKLLAQPIKGTARRGSNEQTDNDIKTALQNDIKERAENVMITDLMRNDLARCCETGSVMVEELFGIYTFPQVHQMISTISGTLQKVLSFTDALRYTFPMGSMTGAPKIKVMQLIDMYEHCRRELFAGTMGYIDPNGDFDFNVVIRSLFYNAGTQYLSYQTGGAITYDSKPENEWEEMRLKAWALEQIFN